MAHCRPPSNVAGRHLHHVAIERSHPNQRNYLSFETNHRCPLSMDGGLWRNSKPHRYPFGLPTLSFASYSVVRNKQIERQPQHTNQREARFLSLVVLSYLTNREIFGSLLDSKSLGMGWKHSMMRCPTSKYGSPSLHPIQSFDRQ